MTAALVLGLAPATASAAFTQPPEAEQPEVSAEQPEAGAEQPEAEPPGAGAEQPEAERSWQDPVDIEPPPEREPLEPEAPETEPPGAEPPEVAAPADEPGAEPPPEGPEPAADDTEDELPGVVQEPTPEQLARAKTLRKAGLGLMASGGVVATTGLGLTIAYTILGEREADAEEPVLADVEQKDAIARVGGILLVSGIAVAAIGGLVFAQGKKKPRARPMARVRMVPAVGGLVLTGQF